MLFDQPIHTDEQKKNYANQKVKQYRLVRLQNQPKYIYDMIYCIICLRRNVDTEILWPKFKDIVEYNIEYISQNMPNRWLNSIIDTYVDYGDETTSAQAMVLSEYLVHIYIIKMMMQSTTPKPMNEIEYGPSLQWVDNGKFFNHFMKYIRIFIVFKNWI